MICHCGPCGLLNAILGAVKPQLSPDVNPQTLQNVSLLWIQVRVCLQLDAVQLNLHHGGLFFSPDAPGEVIHRSLALCFIARPPATSGRVERDGNPIGKGKHL